MSFQDHFSAQAGEYARFRPRYPAALFEWLASIAPARVLAWDCGTGSGQAAIALAAHFERVIASDPSAEQIAHAEPHPRVQYYVGPAEAPPAEAQGAALATCAQALHWFDHARFYPALRATLTSDGVFAAWGYGLATITADVDAVVLDYYNNVVGRYWPPDRRHLEDRYQSLPFPLDEARAPEFVMQADWSLDALLGYLDTWSATRRYLADRGVHPLDRVREALVRAWGADATRSVEWPLFLRVGRFTSS